MMADSFPVEAGSYYLEVKVIITLAVHICDVILFCCLDVELVLKSYTSQLWFSSSSMGYQHMKFCKTKPYTSQVHQER